MLEVISWTVVLFTAATTRYVTPSARIVDTGASLLVRKRCKAGSLSSDGHGSLRQSVDAPNAKQQHPIDANAAAVSHVSHEQKTDQEIEKKIPLYLS